MQVQSQKRIESSESSIKNLWSSTNAQAILDSLVDPLFILDENGVIIEVNSYAEELFEYSRDELIGHINISQLIPILHLDNEESLSKYIEKSVITTGVRKSLRDKKNNLEIDVSLSCYYNKDVISTSSTNITGIYLVSVRDVTRQLTEMEWSKSRYQTEFKEIKCIGKGGFGSVYLAKNKLDEQIYAIKKIPLQCHPQDYIECMNLIDINDKLNEECDSGCSSGCNGLNSEGIENDHYKSDDEKIVENMKSTLTLDDLRVIREVKNFAKFKSHPNVVRYYASWVEPVLLNENLEEMSDSKINSEQRSQEIFDSPPVEQLHPNTPIDMRNNPNTQNEHYSIYDSINLSPMDNSPNSLQQDQIEMINKNTNILSTNQNNDYRNINQNRIKNQNYSFKTKNKTHFETEKEEEEDFDIFGNGPTDLKMMTSIPQNFVNSNKNDNSNNNYDINNSSIITNQNHSSFTSSNNVIVNSKKKEILDFMPSSFESYSSSFDSKQNPHLSSSIDNMKNSISFNNSNNNTIFNTNSNPNIHLCNNNNNNNAESQYNKNVRNFYKNCDNLSQYNFNNDNANGQGSYSTIHESHSFNNISESSTRNGHTSSIYTNDSVCDTSRSDNTSTISDDDESSLTLLELPVINSSNEELNMLSSSQTNLNTYSENEITNTDDSIIIQNENNQQFEGTEEIVRTRFSDENDIFLTYPEDSSNQNDNNNLLSHSGDSQSNNGQCQIYNSSSCINIPNKRGNKCHQSDNETCNSYNSTYSNNSIKTMLLENQYSTDDKKEETMKTQDRSHEEPVPIHANNVLTNSIFEEENDSNSNAVYPNGDNNNNSSNMQDCYDDEFSTGSSVSTIVDDYDFAKSTIYQIPAKTMLYIQMEYSSPNNLRKWIRERNAKIWKHAPFLNNNQENSHVKHSKHWFLDYINRKKNLTLLQQITMGLEHIHKSGFIHRDIKPANIFISENRVMIGDFGLAKRYIKDNTDYDINDLVITDDSGKEHAHHLEMLMKEELAKDNNNNNNNYSMKTVKGGEEHDLTLGVGTLLYASPEQLSRKPYSFATDIYSLSVIMLELFFPFCTSFDRMMHLVNLRKGEIPDCLKKRWPEECELLLSMANVDPQLRPSATEVLETINRLLVRQPSKFSNIKNLYLPKSYDLFNPVFHGLRSSNDSDSQIFEESSMTLSSLSAEEMPMIENDYTIIKSPEEGSINPHDLNTNWSQGKPYIDEINNENGIEKCKEINSNNNNSSSNNNNINNNDIKNGNNDYGNEIKNLDENDDNDYEKINLLINKLRKIQITASENHKEESLNNIINPILEILTKKHNKNQKILHKSERNSQELNTQNQNNTLYNSSQSLDGSLNTTSLNRDSTYEYPNSDDSTPKIVNELNTKSNSYTNFNLNSNQYSNQNSNQNSNSSSNSNLNNNNHQLHLMINGIEANVDREENSDEITPQPTRIRSASAIMNKHSSLNQIFTPKSTPYIEMKSYKLGSDSNDSIDSLSNLQPSCDNTHLSPYNYNHNNSTSNNNNANNNNIYGNIKSKRRNSYSPTHSNEYYLNKLKGIDHDSYYLTSPSNSQREGLLYRHNAHMFYDTYVVNQNNKLMKRNSNRRSSLPNPSYIYCENKLNAYSRDCSSSSSSSKTFYTSSIRNNSKFSGYNQNNITDEFAIRNYHSINQLGNNGECQCDKCNEQESLVLGLLAENATLAKRIKELERRINSNSNSISPFGYHRNGKLK